MSTKTPASTLDKFLEVLSTAANVRASAAAAGISPRTAYRHQKSDPDFAERWRVAVLDALSRIEERIFNAALDGDMQAARWLLARRMPEVYGRRVEMEHRPQVPRRDITIRLVKAKRRKEEGTHDDELISEWRGGVEAKKPES